MVHIGLLIQSSHVFSNGIAQQGYYTRKVLMNAGYTVDLLCSEDHDAYDCMGVPVIKMGGHTDVSIYDLLIFTSSAINTNDEFHTQYMKKIKQHCKVVNMICGNLYFLFQEEFVFDTHDILLKSKNEYYDEIWVLPMYEFMLPFLEVLFKTKARLIPYVWSPDIIEQFMKDHKLVSSYIPKQNSNVYLACAEPNQSVHKNAFTPISIAEDYDYTFPNTLQKMFTFSMDKIKMSRAYSNMKQLFQVVKNNKIECYPRNPLCDTLKQLRSLDHECIFVSHQFMNQLNFVHFELLYLGWPLVHNCKMLEDVGYYYENENVHQARDQIEYARLHHQNIHNGYMYKTQKFLYEYDVSNPKVIETYQTRVSSILSK